MELWDAYDENFRKIEGLTLVRGEPMPAGVRHLVCEILVQHMDGSYLLMQRDTRKERGGLWEASAGGSALKGETPLQCAVRELREETGITAENIREIGRGDCPDTFYVEFLCVTDCDKGRIVFQEGETIAYRWVSREQLLAERDTLAADRVLECLPEAD